MHEFTEYVLPLYDAVSFDLFDTFLLRPVLTPPDMFWLIGGEKFREARIQAENEARNHAHPSYNIDDIYKYIRDEYKHMEAKEIAAETNLTAVNPLMLKAYNKARELGKRIVFTSDMYMPEAMMRKLLAAKGITEYDGLYVSCDRGCSKYDGSLLKLVASELNVEPEKLVHIGDSRGADIAGGARAHVYTQYVPKIADVFFAENPRLHKFFDMCGGHRNDRIRLFFGALALAYHLNKCAHGDDPWYRTGVTFTAPMYYSYMRWVLEQAERLGKKKLLLCLRDCHIIGKMLDRVAPDVDYAYIVLSRAVMRPITERDRRGTDTKAYATCMEYVKSAIPDPDNSVLVEGTSVWRTSEKAVKHAMGRQIPTLYMNLSEAGYVAGEAYLDARHYTGYYILIENAGCSPDNPYSGEIVDGKPVCRPYSAYDKYRSYGVQRREHAAVETAALFHANNVYLTGEECKRFIECSFDNIDMPDATFLINQFAAGDVEHRHADSWYWR